MDKITEGQKVLAIWNQSASENLKNFVNQIKCTAGDGNFSLENSDIITMNSHPQSTFDVVLSNLIPPNTVAHTDKFLSIILNVLKPNGQLILKDKSDNIISQLKLNGFVDPIVDGENIICKKPDYDVGSALRLGTRAWKLSSNVEAVWGSNENDDIIDSDMLLDENDLKKPEAAPLKVCGTTGQRKACADCSCGLAEELRGEVKEQPKSSCGSCYLGDAFRCASCPYLGTPAFKPGEKVLLADLKPDI